MEAVREQGRCCCQELPGLREGQGISCKGAFQSLHFGHNLRDGVAWLPSFPSPAPGPQLVA